MTVIRCSMICRYRVSLSQTSFPRSTTEAPQISGPNNCSPKASKLKVANCRAQSLALRP
ncbi:hypothetical protein D3C71_1796480 [compost metagenome]